MINNGQSKETIPLEFTSNYNQETESDRSMSFGEIVKRVENGESIPGIKIIPLNLHKDSGKKSLLKIHPKPWLKDCSSSK